jgi:hypothetical protein
MRPPVEAVRPEVGYCSPEHQLVVVEGHLLDLYKIAFEIRKTAHPPSFQGMPWMVGELHLQMLEQLLREIGPAVQAAARARDMRIEAYGPIVTEETTLRGRFEELEIR